MRRLPGAGTLERGGRFWQARIFMASISYRAENRMMEEKTGEERRGEEIDKITGHGWE